MQLKVEFSKSFLEGFIVKCASHGLTDDEMVNTFQVHANNAILSRPEIFQGFSARIKKASARTAQMARVLTPEMLSLAVDCRIKYGSDLLSRELRKEAGMPEPDEAELPEAYVKLASVMETVLRDFDTMPLNQKILLAMIAGGAAGGLKRFASPSNEDLGHDRGGVDRTARGILGGAGIGAGVAAGASAGSSLAGPISPDMRIPAMAMGGTLGGLAGNKLVKDLIS